MKILMWIGIVFLIIFVIYALVAAIFAFYVSSPSTHNASAVDNSKSNQYYFQEDQVVYVRHGNFFQIGEVKIEEADPSTFEVIDNSYAKDSKHLYYDGKPLVGVTPDPIIKVKSGLNTNSVDSGYLISGGKVLCYGEIIDGANADSFTYLHGLYGMDEHYLYYYKDIKIPLKATPSAVNKANDQYIKHGDQILYHGEVISENADSFKIINDEYAKDSQHVYAQGELIDGMVPEGFTVISPYYRKDKNQAYYFNTPIPGSDPDTFKVLNDAISKDHQHIYYDGYIISNRAPSDVSRSEANKLQKIWEWKALHLDPKTVIMVPSEEVIDITNQFYAYQNEVYTRTNKLEGVKPDDVVVLNPEEKTFVRIGDQIFYYNDPIAGADPETFNIISDHFSKDVNHVYWNEHKVIDATPLTFEYQENLYASENEAGEYMLKVSEY
ncbi:DKNYY domain-containing protein [Psychromonas arctica]|uniref:DKNYY domain-containing protein n=1 Tax=Psychromonas arctica TaxID=168275 RepID=UPI002FCF7158